jgi:DnaK suppressor protein
VKATAKKNKTTAKASAKPIAKPKAKPVAKKSAKPAGKAAAVKAKAVVKATVKKPVKPVLKAPVKSKPVAKSAAKPAVKAAAKAPAKSVKAPAKPVVKAKAAAKPAVKAKPSSSAKAAPKTVSKAVAKPSKAVPVAKPASKSVSVAAAKAAAVAPAKVMKPAPHPAVPSVSPSMLTPPPPLKPGRRSSARATAHMPPPAPMVPTHAPDAAKASYSTISLPVISPPPHVAAKKDPKLANNWKTKEANALTDEEVKAMPDSEYMNDKQLAFFRHKLSLLKQEIHASAGETTEHLREDTAVVPDPADRATIEEEHALELRTRDRERKLLKKIEQSISRIDAGDYGYCDETGEAIGVGRLIARPTASLSLEAQQRRELKQKMFGD